MDTILAIYMLASKLDCPVSLFGKASERPCSAIRTLCQTDCQDSLTLIYL